MSGEIAASILKDTVSITDDRHGNYKIISDDWNISNPQGYARWFEYRMSLGGSQEAMTAKGQVDEVPMYKKKSPLQRAIQILKRHRNYMFRHNDDSQPISIIITTLAARAYRGERNIESALTRILTDMASYIQPDNPRVPNPTNNEEDFADRWSMPQYRHLRLEENFRKWLLQAQADFKMILLSDDLYKIAEQLKVKCGLNINTTRFAELLKISHRQIHSITPKKHSIHVNSAKPWSTR